MIIYNIQYKYIWLYNMCVCETKWLLAMFFSAVPSHCPHCRAGEVRVAGYTNEERLSCTALPWWIWCARFFLDRLMCFGSFWIMVSKWFKPKRKNINIFRRFEKFWWCWTSLGLWFQDVGSILTYLLVGLWVEMVTPVNPIGLVGDPTSPSHWLSEKSCCVRSRPIYTNIHEDR